MKTVHLDLSQLVMDPRRSGIQRAERELIRHWPGPARLVPCRFDPAANGLHELPESVLAVLCADAPAGGVAVDRLRLERHLVAGRAVQPERLLNAELFVDPARAAYYQGLPDASGVFWLVYDFIPWLHPAWFGVGAGARLMPYLRAMRGVPNLGFISEQTREDCRRRILRRPIDGPVLPMGADGLQLERQRFGPSKRSFVMLGTVEQRKNAAPVMEAFQALWREGVEAELVMIGGTSPDATRELALLRDLAGERRFRHLTSLSDAGVREELRRARAVVFPSVGEGYGIPPMEALHAGIPVVVASTLPALAGQPGLGQIRLEHVTAGTVEAAIRRLLDDGEAAALWDGAARMAVPGWADFARGIAAWVQR